MNLVLEEKAAVLQLAGKYIASFRVIPGCLLRARSAIGFLGQHDLLLYKIDSIKSGHANVSNCTPVKSIPVAVTGKRFVHFCELRTKHTSGRQGRRLGSLIGRSVGRS